MKGENKMELKVIGALVWEPGDRVRKLMLTAAERTKLPVKERPVLSVPFTQDQANEAEYSLRMMDLHPHTNPQASLTGKTARDQFMEGSSQAQIVITNLMNDYFKARVPLREMSGALLAYNILRRLEEPRLCGGVYERNGGDR